MSSECRPITGALDTGSVEQVNFHYIRHGVPFVKALGPANQQAYAAFYQSCGKSYIDLYYFASKTDLSWVKRIVNDRGTKGLGLLFDYDGVLVVSRMVEGTEYADVMLYEQGGRQLWRGNQIERWGRFSAGESVSSKLAHQLKGKQVMIVDSEGYIKWVDAKYMGQSSFLTLGQKLAILAYGQKLTGSVHKGKFRVTMDSRYVIGGF